MKQLLSLALALLPCLAWAQYPSNGNQKITLGEQTTADGLIYRGIAADTTRKPSVDTMAYIILDTTTNLLWHYKKATSNKWLQAGGGDTSSIAYVNTYGTQTVNGAKTFNNPITFNSRIVLTDTLTGFISTPKRIIAPQGLVGKGSGQLRVMETATIAAGTNPYSVTTDPSGIFCYVANFGSANVSQYSINQTTGQLTALSTATISAGTNPVSVTTDPSGRFCYVANYGSANVSQYSINQITGQLTALSTATISAGTNPYSVTTDPSGRFCYVANYGSANVSQYSINQITGQLTALSTATISAGTNPYSVTTDPSGRFFYVANFGSANVSQYSINQTTGQLTALSTATISAGTYPISVTTDPSGRFCYVANYGSANVSQYSINQITGQLTALSTATISAGTNPYSVTTDPSGRFCYVANFGSANVSQYSINQTTGQLTALSTATISAGTYPISVTTDPSGRFFYVANYGGNIYQYQVQNLMPGWFSAVDDEILIGYSADKGNFKLQVKDSVYVGGNVSANGFTTRSDFYLKENIQALDYGLLEIMQLVPVSYNLKSNNSKQLGFIAQEVGTIIPEAVSFEENLAIYYNNLISVIVKAIQELKQEIENLKNK